MDYFPLFLDIKGKKVLIVGGGVIAWRKARLVAQAGPALTFVAPQLIPQMRKLAREYNAIVKERKFRASDLNGATLVFVAVNDSKVRDNIHLLAQQKNIPVNVVDEQRLCSFIMPALVTRDPLVIAITSGGKAPVVARRVREDLEARLPNNYGDLAKLMDELRPLLKDKLSEQRRRHFYEKLWDSEAAELLRLGKKRQAKELGIKLLESMLKDGVAPKGEVHFVGSGEGSPDNLTLGGLRQLHQADVILYDKLVNPQILTMARRDATLVAVGKPPHSQEQINRMMVKYVEQGKYIVRLKGGDPAIFARLHEEINYLKERNIHYKVSPGITAALACAATANLSLTDRNFSHGLVLLSLSGKSATVSKARATTKLPEASAAKSSRKLHSYVISLLRDNASSDRTLVIYMGIENIDLGVAELLKAGMDATMPTLVFEKVGHPRQRILKSSIKDLPSMVKDRKIASPASIIIGKVVEYCSSSAED